MNAPKKTFLFFFLVAPISLLAALPYTFQNGQVANADQVNENFRTVIEGIVPVGVILPWNKNPKDQSGNNMPLLSLPTNWVECNGQVINDSGSSLNGMKVPDLNGVTGQYGNRGLFIRGGMASGVYQNQQLLEHSHADQGHSHIINQSNIGSYGPGSYGAHSNGAMAPSSAGHANLGGAVDLTKTPFPQETTGTENRPVNLSMVWIMRVK